MLPPRRILAAVDFSEHSRVALAAAGQLAAAGGAELIVLTAIDPLLSQAAAVSGVEVNTDTRAALERFVADTGLTAANHLVVAGRAADTICTIARRERADLIVIASHGMTGVGHVMFGSTAERVLHRATVPVLVVPAPERAAACEED